MVTIPMNLFLNSSPHGFMLLGSNMLLSHRAPHFFIDGSIVSSILGSEALDDSLGFLHIVVYIGKDSNLLEVVQDSNGKSCERL